MRPSTAQRLVRFYPRAWRDRYGDEFVDVLEAQPFGAGVVWDVVRAAMTERVLTFTTREVRVAYVSDLRVLVGRPSGFLPLLCSVFALAVGLLGAASTPALRPVDEGAAAHVFQLLIVAQVPVIAFFVVRWARGRTWAAVTVAAIQAMAIVAALAPVWYFHL